MTKAAILHHSCSITFISTAYKISKRLLTSGSYYSLGFDVNGSTVAGAAFRSTFCSAHGRKLWVNGHDQTVLAHEIGHLRSAQHDDHGYLMGKTITPDEEFRISNRSQAAMQRLLIMTVGRGVYAF